MSAPMIILGLDFESYYDPESGYTLSKMTTEQYIRDQRFEALCAGIQTGFSGESFGIPQEQLRDFLARLPWDRIAMVSHNAHFDGAILKHHFGHAPKLHIDTLSMARALNFPKDMSLSLESLSREYGLSPKIVPYGLFKGKRWAEMAPDLRRQMLDGAARDVGNTMAIAADMLRRFPAEELRSVDWTVRAFTEPRIDADVPELLEVAASEHARKEALLTDLGVAKEDLSSNPKFASLLEALGVDAEKKVNAKGELVPALAKSDSFMKQLLEHEDPLISDLAEARLAVKSTIRETRAGKIADVATRGPVPMFYYFSGAQNTTRHSGGDGMNWQNVERKGPLRKCLHAPDGHMLIIIDLSQIECRILNTACGQDDVVEMFRRGEDIYSAIASVLYGHKVTKEEHPEKRGTGKQIILSCGFGSGWMTFQKTAALGTYGPRVILTEAEARAAVALYRERHPRVARTWKVGGDILYAWTRDGIEGSRFNLMGIDYVDGLAVLPSGLKLDYRTVVYDSLLKEYFFHHKRSFARGVSSEPPESPAERWVWYYKRGYRGLYGAKLVQQLTQALAAVHYRQRVNEVDQVHGYRPAMSSHDEAVYVVPKALAEKAASDIMASFVKAPSWLPALPGAAEMLISREYDK